MKKRTKITAAALLGTAAAALGGVYYGYWEAFKADPKRTDDIMAMPGSELYAPYRETTAQNINRLLAEPFERVSICSHDGLRLRGRYYEGEAGQPLFIFFHGYRSTAERDGSGGFRLCKKHGWNVLQVDQRGHGESEGKTVTFGIRERYDCLDWVRWAVRRFGEDTPIFLVGVSMGASTVLMASGMDLPQQVKGIWADCGFSSAEEILRHTIRRRRMPEGPAFLAARLGGKIFGGLDIHEYSALEAVKQAKVPILLIHGEADTMVPCEMAHALKEACAAPVTLLTVPGAPHGICYYVDNDAYCAAVEKLVKDALEA